MAVTTTTRRNKPPQRTPAEQVSGELYRMTIYTYVPQALPDALYEQLRDGRQFMPENGKYDWYERNARWYWSDKTLRNAKQLAFGLRVVCTYTLEDAAQAKALFGQLTHKAKGVQKTVPGAVAIQIVRHTERGQILKARYQWGQLAHPSQKRRWCIVPTFSGTATEEENITIME